MTRGLMYVLFTAFAAYCYANSTLAAQAGRCEKMFDEPAAVATCNTVSNMRGPTLTDEELREIVNRNLYGPSTKERDQEAAERRRAEAEKEQAQFKADQCNRLFVDPSEHESCRILRMTTIRERTDDEMREAVKERLENIQAEERKRKTAIEQEKRRNDAARRKFDDQLKKKAIGFVLGGWETSGFGTVMIIHFTLQNNTATPQKDFVIGCRTYGNSGTMLNAPRRTLYERLEPGARRRFELNMGVVNSQSARASCEIVTSATG